MLDTEKQPIPQALQVVTLEDDHTFKLDEKALKDILMDPDIADLPVVVISIAGAYRGGKSFLLNFFLRYLEASPSSRAGGTWLGEGPEALLGFSWRGGSTRNTKGILLWSDPAIITLPNKQKVAILLMDTQGTFDKNSSVRDNSVIFAMSTLVSSVQIYNLSGRIQEDDLQQLQLFTDYGKLAKTAGSRPFQKLEFLIRDWPYPYEFKYGAQGGSEYLEQQLQVTKDQHPDLKNLRQHLRTSFEELSCFLMPNPGEAVTNPKFNGRIQDLSVSFREGLIELCNTIFRPEMLMIKKINGETLRTKDLFIYFKTYMRLMESDELFTPKTIFAITVEANLLTNMNEAQAEYKKRMDQICGPTAKTVPLKFVKQLHDRELNNAQVDFLNKKALGTADDKQLYSAKLAKTLSGFEAEYMTMNSGKTARLFQEAVNAYEHQVKEISGGAPLCVHAADLLKVHNQAKNAAIDKVDQNRLLVPSMVDEERNQCIQEIEKKYYALRTENEHNNKQNANDLKDEYWTYMMNKCSADPPLSEAKFSEEHEQAMARALQEFDQKRNIPNTYKEDVYKFQLKQKIDVGYLQLKHINMSSNKKSFQEALVVYNSLVTKFSELRKHCRHPLQLEAEHNAAACSALHAFRAEEFCSNLDDFDDNNKDELILKQIFSNHYEAMCDINDRANYNARQDAFNHFKGRFDDLFGFHWTWIFIVPIIVTKSKRGQHYATAREEALDVFYGYRLDRNFHGNDNVVETLEADMKSYAKV